MDATCQNCGAAVGTGYCSVCGQRVRQGVPTVPELFRELVGDLFELDSRLWRSLRPLVLQPGELTTEYRAGRRARYIPPLRMYLVLSLFFFVMPSPQGADLSNGAESAASEEGEFDCETVGDQVRLPWLDAEESREWVRTTCERIVADRGREFIAEFTERVPLLMMLLVPILAAVMRLLYLGGTYHYVEHLLFLVHAHSFAFLVLGLGRVLQVLVGPLARTTALGSLVADFALPTWVMLYFFFAMRRVYGEGRTRTALKYLAIFAANVLALGALMIFAGTYTAITF